MSEQKKKILVEEINYWRKSRLIPEQYCEFLLNLYTAGQAPKENGANGQLQEDIPAFTVPKFEIKWLTIGVPVGVLLYLLFHFTDFSRTMQMTLLIFLIFFSYGLSYTNRNQKVPHHLFFTAASLVLAMAGIYIIDVFHYPIFYTKLYLVAVFLIWYGSGIRFDKRYISYLGVIGLFVLYGWQTELALKEYGFSWWRVQCFWLPLSIVCIATGMVWSRKSPETAAILFFCGISALFGSEITSFFYPEAAKDILLLFLYIKVFFTTLFLVSLKNLWWRWVSTQNDLRK